MRNGSPLLQSSLSSPQTTHRAPFQTAKPHTPHTTLAAGSTGPPPIPYGPCERRIPPDSVRTRRSGVRRRGVPAVSGDRSGRSRATTLSTESRSADVRGRCSEILSRVLRAPSKSRSLRCFSTRAATSLAFDLAISRFVDVIPHAMGTRAPFLRLQGPQAGNRFSYDWRSKLLGSP
jgi:hypothetical protein